MSNCSLARFGRFSVPVLAVVGASNSGKTRVAEGLVKYLSSRDLKVVAIKHCPHGHQIDGTGTDSARLFMAGAVVSIAVSPGHSTVVSRRSADTRLDEVVDGLPEGIDLVIAEGFKKCGAPKIMVLGGRSRIEYPENVIAEVGHGLPRLDVPWFGAEDYEGLTDFVLPRCMTPDTSEVRNSKISGDPQDNSRRNVRLVVDGQDIPLNRFASNAFAGTILGFVHSLHGIADAPRTIEIILSGSASRNRIDI